MALSATLSRLRSPEYRSKNSASLPSRAAPGDAADAHDQDAPGGADRCGHIRVAVRVRPLPAGDDGIIEVAGTGAIAIRKEAATGGNEFLRSQQGRIEERLFNRVFGPDATQREIYSWTCAPLVSEAVTRGKSATIFVYGATGAGKTYTMFGERRGEQRGIIFRGIHDVFSSIGAHAAGGSTDRNEEATALGRNEHFEVKVSFLELYNEVVNDLLQEDGGQGTCRILEDERRGFVKVSNLRDVPVRSAEEAIWHLETGMHARTIEATATNSQSSRAHAAFSLTIERVERQSQGRGPFASRDTELRQLHSKICFIDLAGSERAKATHNTGSALKDGARINQSLLALANCIDALTSRGRDGTPTPRKKAPYRDSKLTLMLKGSLTGEGLVAMIANVHPGRSHFEDSNNTLEYAKRASAVKHPRRHAAAGAMSPSSPLEGGGGSGASSPSCAGRLSLHGRSAHPLRSVSEGDEQVADRCIPSSSTLPVPSAIPRISRHRHDVRHHSMPPQSSPATGAPAAPAAAEAADQADQQEQGPGTGAPDAAAGGDAQDECLSELSLSTRDNAPSETLPAAEASCSGRNSTDLGPDLGREQASTTESGDEGNEQDADGSASCNLSSPSSCGDSRKAGRDGRTRSLSPADLGSRQRDLSPAATFVSIATPEQAGAGAEPCEDSQELVPLLKQIIATLQTDKARLDVRLQAVTQERDALSQKNHTLELERAQLCVANAEKDRQLLALLARCGGS